MLSFDKQSEFANKLDLCASISRKYVATPTQLEYQLPYFVLIMGIRS
jgi:hypothetical protein